MKDKSQLEKDIAFLIDECDQDDVGIGNVLRACEELGNISAEYFADEFVVPVYKEEDQIYDDDYLNIADFNSLYWGQSND